MPVVSIGAPPEMPATSPAPVAPPADVQRAEDPTRMPGPREIPGGQPDDPASPPVACRPVTPDRCGAGRIATNLRWFNRIQTFVISRVGAVGTRGQWRVVEYPTPAMASHAYAKECSRFVSEGFSDYRE